MYSPLLHQRLLDIVDGDYVRASVLHFFGIPFYQFPNETLYAVCRKHGLDARLVIEKLERSASIGLVDSGSLAKVPVDVLVGYLQHAHSMFIRSKLPFISRLIQHIKPDLFDQPDIAVDLKFVFPLFAEDFIRHIHQEEDELFTYILRLQKAMKEGFSPWGLFQDISKHSILKSSEAHLDDDDEMKGIRQLTNDYKTDSSTGTYTKVVYSELKEFERLLMIHSDIENKLLFPKAISLEKNACDKLALVALLN